MPERWGEGTELDPESSQRQRKFVSQGGSALPKAPSGCCVKKVLERSRVGKEAMVCLMLQFRECVSWAAIPGLWASHQPIPYLSLL